LPRGHTGVGGGSLSARLRHRLTLGRRTRNHRLVVGMTKFSQTGHLLVEIDIGSDVSAQVGQRGPGDAHASERSENPLSAYSFHLIVC
ncbi:MAG: hypothetical protein J07HX5_00578, partial [halophilic archaeon J07HX5]